MAQATNLSVSWLASGEGVSSPVRAFIYLVGTGYSGRDYYQGAITLSSQKRRPATRSRGTSIIRLVYELYLRQGQQMDEASLNNLIELASFR